MKLLVCVSKVPETTAKIKFNDDQTAFDESGVKFIMNPYDEWYALVRAVELKAEQGGTVTILNVADEANESILRKGLSIGADAAVRINAEPKSSFSVARQIAAYAKDGGYDIILCGKETIDYNGSEVPGMVAEMLGLPFVSYATDLQVADGVATISREIEGGKEQVEVSGPFVLSAAKGLAEQRIPSMRDIMQARRKKIEVVEPVEASELSTIVHFELPPEKAGVKMVDPDNMEELVRLLHEEAKVI